MENQGLSGLEIKSVKFLNEGNYTFKQDWKTKVNPQVSAELLSFSTEPFSGWGHPSLIFYNHLKNKSFFDQYSLHAFISSPFWAQDSSVVRHKKLVGFFDKEDHLDSPDFAYEGELKHQEELVFWGISNLSGNEKDIYEIISLWESGIIFALPKEAKDDVKELGSKICDFLWERDKSDQNYLDIAQTINFLTENNLVTLYPYQYPDSGTYHLDVFYP